MADWQEMLKDKRLWIGGGLAAALGLGVLWSKRGKAKSPSPSSTSDSPAATTSGYLGGFNSTGTDVANWLGNYSQSLQNQLDSYLKQQQNTPTGTIANDQWGAAAYNWLAQYNKWTTINPTMAQIAINDYVGGKTDVPPWERWTIDEILSGKRGNITEGPGLAPPANLPPGWVR